MRVAIVTDTLSHHKSLCAAIAGNFQVVGIIHPLKTQSSPFRRTVRFLRQSKDHGWQLAALRAIGKLTMGTRNSSVGGDDSTAKPIDFSGGVAAYDQIPRDLIHRDRDIRDSGTFDLIRFLRPDVMLCLGGPIYPKQLIDASPLTLNYHSGISPIYNGSSSIQFAFANSHPHLCGGTLMLMSTNIDGGNILGHYIPAIEAGDTADSLYTKTVAGAAKMYISLLEYLRDGSRDLKYVPQSTSIFYTRAFQLGWYQNAMIQRNISLDISARFERIEKIVEYWRESSQEAASAFFNAVIHGLLWRTSYMQDRQ